MKAWSARFAVPVLLPILAFVAFQPARAQVPDPGTPLNRLMTQHWTNDTGLPSSTVNAVVQSADGYVWIATEEGLARFDGHRFAVFDRRSLPALPASYVMALVPMPDTSLWIGMDGGGVLHMKGGRRLSATNRASGLSSDQVVALAAARSGGVWVGTTDGGLNHVDDKSVRVYGRGEGLPHDMVTAVLEDSDGTVWLGTAAGLAYLRGGRISPHPERLPGRDVLALHRMRDGRIAVGTTRGVVFLRDGRLVPGKVLLPALHILALYEDGLGTLWVGTHGAGVVRVAGDRILPTLADRSAFGTGLIRTLSGDRAGGVWIAAAGAGLRRVREPLVRSYGEEEGLPSDVALAVLQDHTGAMRIGTAGGGVARLRDGAISTTSTAQGLSHNVVISMVEDADSSLWIGTPRGLNRLRDGRITTFDARDGLAGRTILVTFIDSRGTLWLGTNGDGLQRWRPGPRVTLKRADGLPGDVITAIAESAPGDLWIGTRAGLARLREGRVTRGPAALDKDDILALYVDSSRTLWIGTSGGGLGRLRGDQFVRVTSSHGLADDGVYSITEDGLGGIWMSGPRGVSRLDKNELNRFLDAATPGQRIHPRLYGPADGMRTREANGGVFPAAWHATDGSLWFPTIKGVAVFDTRAAAAPAEEPTVVIEGLSVNDSSVSTQRDIHLPPGSSTLRIAFTALEFSRPDQVRFRYRLEGFDTTWTEAGSQRDARYTHVPPGAYTFRVAARVGDGPYTGGGAALSLTIAARFHETALFRLGAAVLLIGLLIAGATGIHRSRLRKLVARQNELVKLVTERTSAEEKYRELFENATDPVFTTDFEGKITEANRRFMELSGFAPEALIGQRLDRFIEISADGSARTPGSSDAMNTPARLARADGTWVSVEVDTRPVVLGGQQVGIQGIARDVTQRRLIEQRVIQAQRMEALGQLAGGVAHDFNNVLVAITGYSELLADAVPAEGNARADLKEIQQAADRAARLTRQLLAFSRQQVLQPRVLSLNDVVSEMQKMLQRLLREDITMELALSPALPTVTADHGQLEQVLLNLIVNARDSMPDGGRVTIETALVTLSEPLLAADRSVIPPDRYAQLAVRDTGCGIPVDVQPRIFEPFFTTKAVGSGTGLGLATVLGIVQQSGGFIRFESTPGAGTTFRVYLPVTAEPPSASRAAGGVTSQSGTETILLVEDDVAVRRTARRVLERRGYTVIDASNGAEALEYLSRHGAGVDLVITDMIMPVMNGHELVIRLREAMPDIRVLLMSGYTRDAMARRDALDGVAGFLEKPFTPDALTSAARSILDAPRGSRPPGSELLKNGTP